MGRRRTNPSYMSNIEVNRERMRLKEMVEGIVGSKTSQRFEFKSKTKPSRIVKTINKPEPKPLSRIWKSDSFIVEYNKRQGCILLYGKEVPSECSFKLSFNKKELFSIIDLLTKARRFL